MERGTTPPTSHCTIRVTGKMPGEEGHSMDTMPLISIYTAQFQDVIVYTTSTSGKEQLARVSLHNLVAGFHTFLQYNISSSGRGGPRP